MSKKLFKIFSVVFIITILIKILDVAKNLIIASILGVSNEADVYSALILIPDSILVLAGIDSIRGVVNSEYSSLFSSGKLSQLWVSFNNLSKIVFFVSIPIAAVIILGNSFVIDILLPGFEGSKREQAIELSFYIFPVLLIKGLIGYYQSVFNGIKKFYFPTIVNVLLTITIFISIFLPYIENELIYNLAIANLVGNSLICIVLALFLVRYGGKITFEMPKLDPVTKVIIKSCGSIFFLVLLNQIFLSSRNFFASFYGQGAIASITYATTITGFITSLAFNSVFSVLLSDISSSLHSKPRFTSKKVFFGVLNTLLYVLLHIVIIFITLNKEILSLVYQRGNFSLNDISYVSNPFLWESLGMISWILYMVPMALYLANKDYKLLLKLGAISFACGIGFNYLFSYFFGYFGVSIGTALTFGIFGMLMLIRMRRLFGRFKEYKTKLLYLFIIFTATLLIALPLKEIFTFDLNNKLLVIQNSAIICFIVLTLYFSFSWILKLNYIKNLTGIFKRS